MPYLQCYPRYRDTPNFNFPVRCVHLTDIIEHMWPRPITIIRIIKHGTDWPRRMLDILHKSCLVKSLEGAGSNYFGGGLFILDHTVARTSLWSEIPNSIVLIAPLIISGVLVITKSIRVITKQTVSFWVLSFLFQQIVHFYTCKTVKSLNHKYDDPLPLASSKFNDPPLCESSKSSDPPSICSDPSPLYLLTSP